MTDWVSRHRHSLQFVVWTVVGIMFIVVGLFRGGDPALIALGAGALGLPGFNAVSKDIKDEDPHPHNRRKEDAK